ncbi:MAG: HesA/MoeB/ThiF family protein [Pseudomonadota bacterium]
MTTTTLEQPPQLSPHEEQVFERQLTLPGFGLEGQRKLKAATVLISRVGGLGGTVAMLLARAGIGRLVLAHGGVVEHENLNRMPLAFAQHLGQPRMAAFVETLGKINPDVALVPCFDNVSDDNVAGLMAQADIVVDASPDFAERYCINAEAVRTRKPVVMAAMNGLECYATTIRPGETPCLACIYPSAPEGWEVTGFPVIAPSSSTIASIAAMEVIKALTGYGRPLENKLLYCDLENNTFSTFNIRRQPDCGVCSH